MCPVRSVTYVSGRSQLEILKPKSNLSVGIGVRLDARRENSQDNAAPCRVRNTGCLPVPSDSIRRRPCSPLRQKCFSNRRLLHRREPCSLSQDPVTNP